MDGTWSGEMKIRNGFVSNSSSCAFIITNKTDEKLTLVDFVLENPQLIIEFREEYPWYDPMEYNQGQLVLSAEQNNETIPPGTQRMIFGDEDGTMVGRVFDYILRDGGESKRFIWRFHEYLR